MAGHFLVLEYLAGILALTRRAVTSMRDRDTVRRAQAAKIVALHDASEALTHRRADDVDKLALCKMRGLHLGPHLKHGIGRHAEFDELVLGLDLGLGTVAAHGRRHVLHLGFSGAKLNGGVAAV